MNAEAVGALKQHLETNRKIKALTEVARSKTAALVRDFATKSRG